MKSMGLMEKVQQGFVYLEGAAGTLLQARGLKAGELPEMWNVLRPEEITRLHYDYLKEGVNILSTNTFGAYSLKYPAESGTVCGSSAPRGGDCPCCGAGSTGKAVNPERTSPDQCKGTELGSEKASCIGNEAENGIGQSKDSIISGVETASCCGNGADSSIGQVAEPTVPLAEKANPLPSLEQVINGAINCAAEALHKAEEDPELAAIDHYIVLDIGPLGRMLKPSGDLDFEDAVELFARTIRIGAADPRVDAILLETMNDSLEVKAAVLAAKENCSLPVIASTTYDDSGRLLNGADAASMVAMLEGLGVDGIGINCGLGPAQMKPIVATLTKYASVPILVNPNAGLPGLDEQGNTVYRFTPELFASEMAEIAGYGARLLGGCCGTGPEHIREMIRVTGAMEPVPLSKKSHSVISSYTHTMEFGGKPVLIGERINPTGKARLKEALRNGDMNYVMKEGFAQKDNGANVLDVNAGLPEIDEPAVLKEMVERLQSVLDLPLQIDTGDPKAMEAAMRVYSGKPLVNSVNGKAESMETVFPLVKKYGGMVVALTLDENGIPETAEGRLAIAERIRQRAAEYGIEKKDIIVDPLALTVSADHRAACVTLDALKLLRDAGYLTSLGVSNISFGLPARDLLNGTFFAMALENGLSAAILNPGARAMMNAYHSFCALRGMDPQCRSYMDYSTNLPVQAAVPGGNSPAAATPAAGSHPGAEIREPLVEAIVKGMAEKAAEVTAELLGRGASSEEIVDGMLIPALNIMGKGFEEKRIFLPQLLMSAESAESAFNVIREKLSRDGAEGEKRGRIVLATVKGDIHDIGKNIVKSLLENYGFDVTDLGRDVAPEVVVQAVRQGEAPLLGLSALMTTTVPAMEATIALLRAEGLPVKVVVGGAVLTQEYADRIGADCYAADAMETVRYAEELLG